MPAASEKGHRMATGARPAAVNGRRTAEPPVGLCCLVDKYFRQPDSHKVDKIDLHAGHSQAEPSRTIISNLQGLPVIKPFNWKLLRGNMNKVCASEGQLCGCVLSKKDGSHQCSSLPASFANLTSVAAKTDNITMTSVATKTDNVTDTATGVRQEEVEEKTTSEASYQQKEEAAEGAATVATVADVAAVTKNNSGVPSSTKHDQQGKRNVFCGAIFGGCQINGPPSRNSSFKAHQDQQDVQQYRGLNPQPLQQTQSTFMPVIYVSPRNRTSSPEYNRCIGTGCCVPHFTGGAHGNDGAGGRSATATVCTPRQQPQFQQQSVLVSPRLPSNNRQQQSGAVTTRSTSSHQQQALVTSRSTSNQQQQPVLVSPRVPSNYQQQVLVTSRSSSSHQQPVLVSPRVPSNQQQQQPVVMTPRLQGNNQQQPVLVSPRVPSNQQQQQSVVMTPRLPSNNQQQQPVFVSPRVQSNYQQPVFVSPRVQSNYQQPVFVTPRVPSNYQQQQPVFVTPRVPSTNQQQPNPPIHSIPRLPFPCHTANQQEQQQQHFQQNQQQVRYSYGYYSMYNEPPSTERRQQNLPLSPTSTSYSKDGNADGDNSTCVPTPGSADGERGRESMQESFLEQDQSKQATSSNSSSAVAEGTEMMMEREVLPLIITTAAPVHLPVASSSPFPAKEELPECNRNEGTIKTVSEQHKTVDEQYSFQQQQQDQQLVFLSLEQHQPLSNFSFVNTSAAFRNVMPIAPFPPLDIVYPPLGIVEDDGVRIPVLRAPRRIPNRVVDVASLTPDQPEYRMAEYNSCLLYLNPAHRRAKVSNTLPFLVAADNSIPFLPEGTLLVHIFRNKEEEDGGYTDGNRLFQQLQLPEAGADTSREWSAAYKSTKSCLPQNKQSGGCPFGRFCDKYFFGKTSLFSCCTERGRGTPGSSSYMVHVTDDTNSTYVDLAGSAAPSYYYPSRTSISSLGW